MLLCVSLQIDRRLKTPSWGTTAASRRRIRCFCWGVWGERSLCLRIRLFQILTLMIYTKILCELQILSCIWFCTYVNKWWAKDEWLLTEINDFSWLHYIQCWCLSNNHGPEQTEAPLTIIQLKCPRLCHCYHGNQPQHQHHPSGAPSLSVWEPP